MLGSQRGYPSSSRAQQAIHRYLAHRKMDASLHSSFFRYLANAAAHSHTRASRSDLCDTIATLSADRKRIHATRRRAAVEIATCRRQCAVALRSNFCRHTNRMVNRQANVLTCADIACRRLIWGRVRARFHNDTSPCRCDRFAIEPAGGVIRVFNFRGQKMKLLLLFLILECVVQQKFLPRIIIVLVSTEFYLT